VFIQGNGFLLTAKPDSSEERNSSKSEPHIARFVVNGPKVGLELEFQAFPNCAGEVKARTAQFIVRQAFEERFEGVVRIEQGKVVLDTSADEHIDKSFISGEDSQAVIPANDEAWDMGARSCLFTTQNAECPKRIIFIILVVLRAC